jgi:hypothetical protein
MNIGQLKQFLEHCSLPDSAEVVIAREGDTFYTCHAEESGGDPPDSLGQVRYNLRLAENEPNILVLRE